MTRNVYGPRVLDHYRHPRNQRSLADATATAEGHNPMCGDRVRIELAVTDGAIRDAAFTANSCVLCTAAASIITERLAGVKVSVLEELRDDDVLSWLDAPVAPARVGCATLPVRTARRALNAAQGTRGGPA